MEKISINQDSLKTLAQSLSLGFWLLWAYLLGFFYLARYGLALLG